MVGFGPLQWSSRMTVGYAVEGAISPEEFVDILRRSGLAERRPVDQPDRIRRMVENANLIVCARDGGLLVGVESRRRIASHYSVHLTSARVTFLSAPTPISLGS